MAQIIKCPYCNLIITEDEEPILTKYTCDRCGKSCIKMGSWLLDFEMVGAE